VEEGDDVDGEGGDDEEGEEMQDTPCCPCGGGIGGKAKKAKKDKGLGFSEFDVQAYPWDYNPRNEPPVLTIDNVPDYMKTGKVADLRSVAMHIHSTKSALESAALLPPPPPAAIPAAAAPSTSSIPIAGVRASVKPTTI